MFKTGEQQQQRQLAIGSSRTEASTGLTGQLSSTGFRIAQQQAKGQYVELGAETAASRSVRQQHQQQLGPAQSRGQRQPVVESVAHSGPFGSG